MANLDLNNLKKEVLGQDLSEAKNLLEGKEEIEQVEFVFNPPFLAKMLKKLPTDEARIVLEIAE